MSTGVATLTMPTPTPIIARPKDLSRQLPQIAKGQLTCAPHADGRGEGVDESSDDEDDVGDDDAPSSANLGREVVANEGREDRGEEEGGSVDT